MHISKKNFGHAHYLKYSRDTIHCEACTVYEKNSSFQKVRENDIFKNIFSRGGGDTNPLPPISRFMATALWNYFTSSANGQGSEFCTVRNGYNVCDFALLSTYKNDLNAVHC